MRKVALFATVVCLSFYCSFNALAADTVTRFLGKSTNATTGAHGGQTGMNQMCANTFSNTTGAHMCNVDEFFRTAGITAVATAGNHLWLQPALHNCAYDGTQVSCQETGLPGLVPEADFVLPCSGWSTASGTGTSVIWNATTGWLLETDTDCGSSYHVACCAP